MFTFDIHSLAKTSLLLLNWIQCAWLLYCCCMSLVEKNAICCVLNCSLSHTHMHTTILQLSELCPGQPSLFILAWDMHQICWLAYPVAYHTDMKFACIIVCTHSRCDTNPSFS